jgi:hypothetical protein
MAKKPAKKSPKAMNRKQMKKTTGGIFVPPGSVQVAVGDVNGDLNGGFKAKLNGDGKPAQGSFTGGV